MMKKRGGRAVASRAQESHYSGFIFAVLIAVIVVISVASFAYASIHDSQAQFDQFRGIFEETRKVYSKLPLSQGSMPGHAVEGHLLSANISAIKSDKTHVSPDIPRLLFMIASNSMSQFLYLQKAIDCMRDHCNAGWNVTVHISASGEFDYDHPRYKELADRSYCIRSNSPINIVVDHYDNIGFGLNCKHRLYMRDHIDDFDYFSYAEEDMLLTVSHLQAVINTENDLKRDFPTSWMNFAIGFLRWEDSTSDGERVSWEYRPNMVHVLSLGGKKYIVTNNQNQAIFVFSQSQIIELQNRCNFLYDIGQNDFYRALRRAMDLEWKYMSVGVSEWSSSFQHILQCGLRRVIPVDHFELFFIHHSSNKAQVRRPKHELLNARSWKELVESKLATPVTLQQYDQLIIHQYNLHLIEKSRFQGKSVWTFDKTNSSLHQL